MTPTRLEGIKIEEELDLGNWLERAEKICLRMGLLKERKESEKTDVLERMKGYRKKETSQQNPDDSDSNHLEVHQEVNLMPSGTGKHTYTGAGEHSNHQEGAQEHIINVPSGTGKYASTGNGGKYNLLGLIDWWRRIKKQE